MDLPSAKDIKKLAKACRAAGITSFKGCGIEFTLGAEAQPRVVKSNLKQTPKEDLGENTVETDELAPDAMLFWSVSDQPEESKDQ